MKDEILKKIREIGIPEQEVENFYVLLSEEVLDVLFQDLAGKLTDEELEVINNRIKESKSKEHLDSIIKEIAITSFGENYLTEINNIYLDLIDDAKDSIAQARELLLKAQNGDPEALAALEKAKQTDIYKGMFPDTV